MHSLTQSAKYFLIKYPLCKQAVAQNKKQLSRRCDEVLIAKKSWTIDGRESSCKKVSRNYNPDPLLSQVGIAADRKREDCYPRRGAIIKISLRNLPETELSFIRKRTRICWSAVPPARNRRPAHIPAG
jgi:hypothetical protein